MPSRARTRAQTAALTRAISPERLSTFTAAAAESGADALDLYLWDRDLAAALLGDIAIVEVALRNSMHAALTVQFGRSDWFSVDIGLDSRSQDNIAAAWSRLPGAARTPGRVVAQLMFGFWRDLLEAGGRTGKGPLQRNCDYEKLWRQGLSKAFPGGRAEANAQGARFTRRGTLEVVGVVHALRNRAAHHEPLISGFPMPGRKDSAGAQVRHSVLDGHRACLSLARMLDRDLGSWLADASRVGELLANRP